MVRDPDPGDFALCALVPDAPKFPVKGLGGCEILGAGNFAWQLARRLNEHIYGPWCWLLAGAAFSAAVGTVSETFCSVKAAPIIFW